MRASVVGRAPDGDAEQVVELMGRPCWNLTWETGE